MNKLIPLIAFSVLLLVPAGAQSAFAQEAIPSGTPVDGDCTSNGTGGGPWSEPDTWDCVGVSDVPASRKQVTIQSGDTVTVDRDLNRSSGIATTFIGDVFVEGTLVVPSPFTFKSDFMQIFTDDDSATVENHGNMIIAVFFNFNIFNNTCGSTLTIQQLFTNKDGTLGPVGRNSDITCNSGLCALTNFGTFELGILFGPNNLFTNVSPFQNGGSLINVIESGQGQNFGGSVPITTIPSICTPVGGELIPIETTSLLLAGAQSFSWMIPVILSVLGIGLFVFRKSENS